MKTIIYCAIASLIIANDNTACAQSQPPRLMARTNQINGVLDSVRFYYSGTRTGNKVNTEADMLPVQTVTRNGQVAILFDSAVTWRVSGGTQSITDRTTIKFDFANRVTQQKRIQYSGGAMTDDAAYSYTALGLMDSAQFISSIHGATSIAYTYTASGYPLSDTLLTLPANSPFMSVAYGYNSASQLLTKVRNNLNVPGQTIADSTINRYNALGLLETTDWYFFDGGNVYMRNQDSFGYTGSNRPYTYKNTRFIDYRLSTAWVNNTQSNFHLRPDGQYDTIKNFIATSAGPYPTTPSQLINVSYNADSTVHQLVGFSMGSTAPFVNYRYYYDQPGSTSVSQLSPEQSCKIVAYPVPAHSGAIQIVITGIKENADYVVINSHGQTVQEGNARANIPFRLRNLPTGSYIIRCSGRSHKMLIQ